MKKRIKMILFSLIPLFAIIFVFKFPETASAATTLKNNTWAKDIATGKTPVEFSFKIPDNGYFYYEAQPTEDYYYYDESFYERDIKATGTDVNYVRTSMSADNKLYENSQLATRQEGFRSNRYSFPKGMRVKITVYNGGGYYVPFAVRLVFKKVANFETEWNDTKSKADLLAKGKSLSGVLMKNSSENGDVDWWVFKAPATGKYKIVLRVTNEDTDHGLTYDTWKGTKILGTAQLQSGEGSKKIFYGKLTKGQKLYVKLYKGNAGTLYKLQAS